jgi:hypothetical protein
MWSQPTDSSLMWSQPTDSSLMWSQTNTAQKHCVCLTMRRSKGRANAAGDLVKKASIGAAARSRTLALSLNVLKDSVRTAQ